MIRSREAGVMNQVTIEQLQAENDSLRLRMQEAEEALQAIRLGEVDAIVVENETDQIYTLETADRPYRLLVEQMPHGAVTLTVDGSILYCNRRFGKLVRVPVAQLLGRPIREFITPDSWPAFESLLADGQMAEVQGEVSLRRPDGVTLPAYLGVNAFREGAHGLCLMVTDLTEQRHYQELQITQSALQQALTEREEAAALLSTLLEAAPVGFAYVDRECRWLRVNEAAASMNGVPREQHLGRRVSEVLPEIGVKVEALLRQVLTTGEPLSNVELVHRTHGVTGDERHWLASYYPVRTSKGELLGAGWVALDITAQKRLEQALRDDDRRKDEFLATLAHELRNPLAPIRNAVQILKAKGLPYAELQWARGVLDRQLQIMTRLLEDLLDVSRISRNSLELRKERVDLASIVSAALETSRPVVDEGAHELTVTLPDRPIYFDVDSVRMAQVFANLLNNAAKYTERGGQIGLRLERRGQEVVVSVKDSGIGIAADALPRIFGIFSQAKPALERSQGGLGIGLWLVKRLVELHGGSVEAYSEGANRGSEFIVRLPIHDDVETADAPTSGDDTESRAAQDQRKILVVDDNRDSADSLAMALKLMGSDVATAYDGEQAVKAVESLHPDVMLLDIGMPLLNGYDACRRIRSQPWGRDVFIVALTGWSQVEDQRRAEEAGFNAHMVKPVDHGALKTLLAKVPRRKGVVA
ncbi:MAG: PAS domain-containing protein [Planctomycetaceae bacterium]|nr:PAS domain-containing protein [Planctomycetaceae bacterium]